MHNMYQFVFSLSLITVLAKCEVARYDFYRVYQVLPVTLNHLRLLSMLKETSDSYIFLDNEPMLNQYCAIMVAPHKFADFVALMMDEGINHRMAEENMQSEIDQEQKTMQTARQTDGDAFGWKAYYPLKNIYRWMFALEKKYPRELETVVGGASFEGRDILGLRLSHKPGNPGIVLEGGTHAREWISPATVTFIMNQLLTSNNTDVRDIAENFDWYIFPSTNPDGYAYTFKSDRMWRKTRTPNGKCFGADPNRNWNFHWMKEGASMNPCSQNYAGKHPFSEIETKSFANYLMSIRENVMLYLSFHAHSQLLMYPYSHTVMKAGNHADLKKIANAAVRSLAKRYGTNYKIGTAYEAIYPASGTSMDFAYGALKIPLVFTYELRPKRGIAGSWNGFTLPANQIIPTGLETLDSIVTILKEARSLDYY